MDSQNGTAGLQQFYVEAQRICDEAQFVLDSLPNVEIASAERYANQLNAICQVLSQIDDPSSPPEDIANLVAYVHGLLTPLEEFILHPPSHPRTHIPTQMSGSRGRPSYVLDIQRALELHTLGNSWQEVATVLGVSRRTLYYRIQAAGLSPARKPHTDINDDELDDIVRQICLTHPFVGSTIVQGHLEAMNIHVGRPRVQECLRRVDAAGVLMRWAGIIRRRVYRVRGSNALWHIDGNEKLKPWGFYVHGCVDGHSRLIIYLLCASNKRAMTVLHVFLNAVAKFGWPSRGRGDFGTENNKVEDVLNEHWGEEHRAFLRGRSLHNVRIERLWRDVRKDSLEAFRQVFMHLEETELLDMEDDLHRVCLFLVYHRRVQDSLNRTRDAWNHHKLRTEHHRSPVAIYELSREMAIQRGYWTGDPGDSVNDATDPLYGVDPDAPRPPSGEPDPEHIREEPAGMENLRAAGIAINDDDELAQAKTLLGEFDFDRDDGNWGIDVYCEAVLRLRACVAAMNSSNDNE